MAQRRTKGEGTIYSYGTPKRWVAQITLPNGQRKSKKSKSQKVVKDWLIDRRKKASDGLYVADEQIKLGDFLDRYMQDVAVHNLRPRSFDRQLGLVDKHIKPELGNIKINAIRPDQVQALYSKKLDEGLSESTVRQIHAVLYKALNQALKWGLVIRNVTDLVDKPKQKRKPIKTWSAHEVNRFLDVVADHRWYPLYMLAVYTGMRQGELLGLHREDIDLDNGLIQVQRQVSAIRGQGLTVTELKTEKANRPITNPATVGKVLRDYIDVIGNSPGLIFTTSTGKPISPRNLLRHFKNVVEKTNLTDIRFHDLRHTHATLLLAAGVHPKVVQERLGHAQIALTLDTYSHVIPSLQTEAAKQIENILS